MADSFHAGLLKLTLLSRPPLRHFERGDELEDRLDSGDSFLSPFGYRMIRTSLRNPPSRMPKSFIFNRHRLAADLPLAGRRQGSKKPG
jgi:hypothetical protein